MLRVALVIGAAASVGLLAFAYVLLRGLCDGACGCRGHH